MDKLLELLNFVLPNPNNLVKSKYKLLKLLETLLPKNDNVIKKHAICENCSHYLGLLNSVTPKTECENCKVKNKHDIFIEYNLKQLIKDTYEVRDLKKLIIEHSYRDESIDENTICDFTSAREYKKLKETTMKNPYDVCLIWNTDGAPVSKSSNGQIWPIQVKILNIPPEKRRDYQFLTGLYYSNKAKPVMNSFLKPFTDTLKDLYLDGIEWFDKSENKMERRIVIAPITTLECPAGATVQHLMQFNGAYGCTLCEHPGMSCATGKGHDRVYPILRTDPPLRSNESILAQARIVINDGREHLRGVKGVSITATIPFFNCATSFVPDYRTRFYSE